MEKYLEKVCINSKWHGFLWALNLWGGDGEEGEEGEDPGGRRRNSIVEGALWVGTSFARASWDTISINYEVCVG